MNFSKIKTFASLHKPLSIIVAMALFSSAYAMFGGASKSQSAEQYVFGRVQKGDLVMSVSGTGQVSTLSEVDIKAQTVGQTQTLGHITAVKVQNGDFVKAGQVIAYLDGKNALQVFNQAKANVESAQANYNKLVNGPTDLDLASTKNSIESSQNTFDNIKQNALIKLRSAYASVGNAVYISTDPLFSNPLSITPILSISGVTFASQQLQNNVQNARGDFNTFLPNWKSEVDSATVDSDIPSILNDVITKLNRVRSYFDDMSMLFSTYSIAANTSAQSSIDSDKTIASGARASTDVSIVDLTSILQSYTSAQTTLEQNKNALALKIAPPSVDDITVAKSELDNAEANYENALQNYESRIITAPFDGQIGGLIAQVGMQVSSSDSLGKIITAQKIVNISLNEVDAAKVVAGDLAVLTFDALPDTMVKGHVSFIDPLGVETQGVVNYAVRIALDDTNDEIKTGMTASAEISTETHAGVLIVPTSAIKTSGKDKYVLVADTSSSTFDFSQKQNFGTTTRKNMNASGTFAFASSTRRTNASSSRMQGFSSIQFPVKQVFITLGISNDTSTEILSGLNEGDIIAIRTISNGTKTTVATSSRPATNGGVIRFGSGGGLFGR